MPLDNSPQGISGRGATKVVAASNATTSMMEQADYVCDGVADDVQIQAAINALPAAGIPGGGTVQLSEGTFTLAAGLDFAGKTVRLLGMGERATRLIPANGANATLLRASATNYESVIRDMRVAGNSANQASGWLLDTTNMNILTVENVSFDDGKDGCVKAPGSSEWCIFRNVGASNSPYGFDIRASWYQFYDCTATSNATEAWNIYTAVNILLVGCTSDQAVGATVRAEGFMIYNSSRITLMHCRAFGDPTTPKLTRGFRINNDSGTMHNVRLYACEVQNVDLAGGYAYAIDNAVGTTTRNIHMEKCMHSGKALLGLRTALAVPLIASSVTDCDFSAATTPISYAYIDPGDLQVRNVYPFADPGNAGAIPIYSSGKIPLVTAGAETRTLAAPSFPGQELTLYCKTYVGNIVVTCATTINETGNNTITFTATGQAVKLFAVEEGSTLRWRCAIADGAGLSTV